MPLHTHMNTRLLWDFLLKALSSEGDSLSPFAREGFQSQQCPGCTLLAVHLNTLCCLGLYRLNLSAMLMPYQQLVTVEVIYAVAKYYSPGW